jgi:beta-glucanase (GH16 family)
MPVTPGAWGAFWAMGANFTRTAPDANGRTLTNWPYCGEVDTVETFGQHPHKAGFALHMTTTGAPNDTTTAKPDLYVGWDNSTALYESPTLNISRPTYYGFWNSGTEIRRYVNRRETFRYTQAQATAAGAAWPFNQPQFLILNLAVGGQAEGKVSGQAPGVPSFIDAGMGAAMTVEPIRVWNSVTSPTTLGLQ